MGVVNAIQMFKQSNEKNFDDELFTNESKKNKITLIYKIIPGENIKLFGSKFIENNKEKCWMVIDFIKTNIKEYYKPMHEASKLSVILSLSDEVHDISYMFHKCSSLISIPDFNDINLNNITNMSNMFSGCALLQSCPDISKLKTNNVDDMSYLFNECSSLVQLDDISKWDTRKVTTMKSMFSFCSSLKVLPNINRWNTKSVNNISNMFHGCSSLNYLPDISSWNTNNITDISFLFCRCSLLKSIPDISQWNTQNVTDMSHLFHGCSSLESLPNLSYLETYKVNNMSYLFYGCSSLTLIPFLSEWKTDNVTDMSYMFHSCYSLTSLDVSNWNTDNIIDVNMMFSNCYKLKTLPNISNWKCNKKNDINEDKDINNINDINDINENNDESDNNKIEVKGPIRTDKLKLIPQIEFKFNFVDKYDNDLIDKLKEELKTVLGTDDFSIVEIKKGSLTIILTLQCIILNQIKNMDDTINTLDKTFQTTEFFNGLNSEVEKMAEKIKEHEFVLFGTKRPDFVDPDITDINSDENKRLIANKILGVADKKGNDNINILEQAKSISKNELEQYFKDLSTEAKGQETNLNNMIQRLDEFNNVFDDEIEKILEKSYFEYKIDNIFLVDKDNTKYLTEKRKCPNLITKILLHGTNVNAITNILSTNFRHARIHAFGLGVYFTDILDYAWYYGGRNTNRENFCQIPSLGDFFTCVASEIYYDNSKVEIVYGTETGDLPVQKNGIRCISVDYWGNPINQYELENFKGFKGKEYLLTEESQYIPLYGIVFRRVEYLVIWRDYNFNPCNPNNYSNFYEMQNFHKSIKKYIYRELNSKIYYVENDQEAFKLINRKKYNKVILITNGNNNGINFIIKAREILGSNSIAAVSCYNVNAYINSVQNLENVLILNGEDFHKKFFKCIKMNDKILYRQLKDEINNEYNFNLNDCTENLFNYPKFKSGGSFGELTFNEIE